MPLGNKLEKDDAQSIARQTNGWTNRSQTGPSAQANHHPNSDATGVDSAKQKEGCTSNQRRVVAGAVHARACLSQSPLAAREDHLNDGKRRSPKREPNKRKGAKRKPFIRDLVCNEVMNFPGQT